MASICRETGWSRAYVLWQLPYSAGLGICHAAALYNGTAMEWASPSLDGREAMAGPAAQLAKVRGRYGGD